VARRLEAGWQETLDRFVERNQRQGVTHLLLAQPEVARISLAALIPLELVSDIWWGQYQASNALIREGRLGRATKNHAANGHSPTLWLQDDRFEDGHRVADVLWQNVGVIDLRHPSSPDRNAIEDTFDDCPGITADVGRDQGVRVPVNRSTVARDRAVRDQVRLRAAGACERCGCSRDYPGFLDVHHVMGVEKSDRVWTCVGLCPNCHREAHCSPDADAIRAELSAFALRFQPK
jgi:5-methylcytosine-specific restriction protein A